MTQKEISKVVLDAKIVDFDALGKTVASLGPKLATLDDPWENFCGTMRYYIRIYRLPPIGPRIPEIDNLEKIQNLGQNL